MFVELKSPDGGRMLVNLDLTYAFVQQPDGSTQAVSINGVGVPVAESIDVIANDVLGEAT